MEVLRFQASEAVKPFVNHYSFINEWPANARLHPLPNTLTELVCFTSDFPEVVQNKEQSIFKSQVLLIGQLILHDYELQTPEQNLASFHISFTPFGLHSLFNIPAREFRNVITPANEVFPQFAQIFASAVIGQNEPSQMALAADTLLQKLIPEKLHPIFKRLEPLARRVNESCGVISLHKLQKESCLCEKLFVRSFFENSGLFPHEFCKIIRLTHVLNDIMKHESGTKWYDIMEKYGYFDQSHFIKDVKKYTGRTPGALVSKSHILCQATRYYLSFI